VGGSLARAHRPQRLSKDPASLAGLPIYPRISGRPAEMASGQNDLIDRHWGENRFRITDWLLSKPDKQNSG
jgi:hypothetical protein